MIGRTYFDFDIASVLEQENVDELLRELAIVISERNVVFLRNQAGKLSNDQLKMVSRLRFSAAARGNGTPHCAAR